MTRDEAIKWLQGIEERYFHGGDEDYDKKRREAVRMAIEALDKPLPKPHERLMHWDTARRIIDSPRSKSQMLAVLDSVPPVEALERQQGEWIKQHKHNSYLWYEWYECSVCGHKPPNNQFGQEWHSNFCPNCGARMDERGEDDKG